MTNLVGELGEEIFRSQLWECSTWRWSQLGSDQGLMEQVRETWVNRKPDSDPQGQSQTFVTIFSLEGSLRDPVRNLPNLF